MKCAFVLENILGHATHAANLKRVVAAHSDIAPFYVDLAPAMRDHHWLFKLPRWGEYFRLSWALRCAFEAQRQLAPQIKTLDALYFHTQVTAGASLTLMKKRPCVLSLDAAPYCETFYQPWDSPARRARKKRHYKRLFEACAHLVAWSQWTKDNLVEHYNLPPEKISVIAPGVDTGLFRPGDQQQSTRGGDGVVRILFVGGEFRRKGGAWLSRWAQRTQAQNWELHIVTRDQLSSRRYKIPRVVVHHGLEANSKALIALYRRCDIFAFPTRFDCLGVAAIEALACGLPVVLTDVGATREVVLHQKTGFLIGLDDREQFGARLDELVGDANLRQTMSEAARRDALARFDADQNYGRLLDLLRAQVKTG